MKLRDILASSPLLTEGDDVDPGEPQIDLGPHDGGTSRYLAYKPRGGFTPEKVNKHLRSTASLTSDGSLGRLYNAKGASTFAREIRRFASAQELAEHLYWHGSANFLSGGLKPGSVLPKHVERGGGYDEPYSLISVSKSKQMASNFTGMARHGMVYPVLLRHGARVISLPGVTDSQELEHLVPELWNRHIDAVKIGDWSNPDSEQELCVVNPRAVLRGSGENFVVFNKKKFENPTMEDIQRLFDQAHNPPR